MTGYTVRYRQTPNTFTGNVFVGIDQPTTWEYRGLQEHTQYCVQVLGETKYGRGPENYSGCVNVTTDVGGKKSYTKVNLTIIYLSNDQCEPEKNPEDK